MNGDPNGHMKQSILRVRIAQQVHTERDRPRKRPLRLMGLDEIKALSDTATADGGGGSIYRQIEQVQKRRAEMGGIGLTLTIPGTARKVRQADPTVVTAVRCPRDNERAVRVTLHTDKVAFFCTKCRTVQPFDEA